MRPGYKTTEFWLTLAATFFGLLVASGAVSDASSLGKVIALAVSMLSALGYTFQRGGVKKAESAERALVESAKPALPAGDSD